jgi:hypothetical protein
MPKIKPPSVISSGRMYSVKSVKIRTIIMDPKIAIFAVIELEDGVGP